MNYPLFESLLKLITQLFIGKIKQKEKIPNHKRSMIKILFYMVCFFVFCLSKKDKVQYKFQAK